MLRTTLTVLIIAVGITALVGILTAIDAIKQSINNNFTSMGANTFSIRNREAAIHIGRKGKRPKRYPNITYDEAQIFRSKFSFPATVSISTRATDAATLKYRYEKTNPNIGVMGGDENYLPSSGYEIDQGRNFSLQEVQYNANVVLIGSEIKTQLFTPREDPLGRIISIGAKKYKVIGVLKERGSAMGGMGGDKTVIIPLGNARQAFSSPNPNFVISVLCRNPKEMELAIGEATGVFRHIRKLNLSEETNFDIQKSDSLANILIENIRYVTLAATIIGFITLLGAAVGLMNIMLVSVTERTREIGVRKSMGATQKNIRNQFLTEAIIICQLGGLLGIVLGIIIGNITSSAIGAGFIIPWTWIITGFLLCFVVGLVAGIYPAARASKLDPIDALRAE